MKVLLIRPEDSLLDDAWLASTWDRVVDLGRAGRDTYAEATSRLGSSITSLHEVRDGFNDLRRVRDLLAFGLGKLKDGFDLDWWELTAIEIHERLETIVLLQKLAATIGASDEVYVSGPGFHADALRFLLGRQTGYFTPRRSARGIAHYLETVQKFPLRQLLEIFWDKADPGYQIRGLLNRRQEHRDGPVVLLPTAYINVSRTGIAYARTLPDMSFLLVATRRSGWVEDRPPNVSFAWLRSYASVHVRARKLECQELTTQWEALRKELEKVAEFSTISRVGYFRDFPARFRRGLEIRDAWRNVLDAEPVKAVICADDSNSYTHIPLLLAKKRGLPTISCHHGALDGRYMFKQWHADVILAKGKMEEDYLVRMCGLPAERVAIGGPSIIHGTSASLQDRKRHLVVLFSEPYEAMGGRATDVYRDLLPRLCDLAHAEGRQLVVKLHPFESRTERKAIIDSILPPDEARNVLLISGPLQSELLNRIWFGITILSTVAVECALRDIPCFLCKWLESTSYGYIDQFTRFGIGIRLDDPDDIYTIPAKLRNPQPSTRQCVEATDNNRLRLLLGTSRQDADLRTQMP